MGKIRILAVDDDYRFSGLLKLTLEGTGRYEVLVENRPQAALASARFFLPQLILMDVDMPGKTGGEVAREFAEEPAFKSVPLVFLTSLLSPNDPQTTMGSNGKRYLSKAMGVTALLKEIGDITARIAPKPDSSGGSVSVI